MFLSIPAPKVSLFLSHKLNFSLTPALHVCWEPSARLVFARRASAWGRESGLSVSWRPCGGPETDGPFPRGADSDRKDRGVRRGACAVTHDGVGATSAQTAREQLSEEGHPSGDPSGRRRRKEGGGVRPQCRCERPGACGARRARLQGLESRWCPRAHLHEAQQLDLPQKLSLVGC